MANIIGVDPIEAREWLRSRPSWDFNGKVNQLSNSKILGFVNTLYEAGGEQILISEYDWEIEPVYEGYVFHPDMLIIKLPSRAPERQEIYNIVNNTFPELKARIKYNDNNSDNNLWYFFEPEPQKITVGGREITWYT